MVGSLLIGGLNGPFHSAAGLMMRCVTARTMHQQVVVSHDFSSPLLAAYKVTAPLHAVLLTVS